MFMGDNMIITDINMINNQQQGETITPPEKPFPTISLFNLTCGGCGTDIPAGTEYIYDNSKSLCKCCGSYAINKFNRVHKKEITNQTNLEL